MSPSTDSKSWRLWAWQNREREKEAIPWERERARGMKSAKGGLETRGIVWMLVWLFLNVLTTLMNKGFSFSILSLFHHSILWFLFPQLSFSLGLSTSQCCWARYICSSLSLGLFSWCITTKLNPLVFPSPWYFSFFPFYEARRRTSIQILTLSCLQLRVTSSFSP